jgi:hypothetical protein
VQCAAVIKSVLDVADDPEVRYNVPLHQWWPFIITSPVLLNMLPVSCVPPIIAAAGVAASVTTSAAAAIPAPSLIVSLFNVVTTAPPR